MGLLRLTDRRTPKETKVALPSAGMTGSERATSAPQRTDVRKSGIHRLRMTR